MTDEQLCKFMLHRAKLAGQEHNLRNPKFVIKCKFGWNNSLYLAIKYDNKTDFFIRFVSGSNRGIFTLKVDNPEFYQWKNTLSMNYRNATEIDYDPSSVPNCVKHFISYAFIEAFKTNGIGFDLFSIDFTNDLPLIKASESYEELSIESDLTEFMFD